MTDIDIIQELAVEVMGWQWNGDKNAWGIYVYSALSSEPRWEEKAKAEWNPLVNLNDAWMMADRLSARGEFTVKRWNGGVWKARFWLCNQPPGTVLVKTANTAPRAICLAALQAING